MKSIGFEGSRSAIDFMDDVLPSLEDKGLNHVIIVQQPGEVVVFPAGWWHAVVNLDATLAVTESWGEPTNRALVVQNLRAGRLDTVADIVSEDQCATVVNGKTQ